MNIERFVNDVVTTLTGKAPDVPIDEDEYGAIVSVKVYGRISSLIGKNGITIDAFRTMLKAIGYNDKHRIKLKIDEQT